jgi:cystathionine beta-synthase
MDASSVTSAVQRPGRGRVFDSIVDAIGDTPIVRLRKLPEAHGVSATILAKLEYFNPAASVKDRIGAAMVIAMEKAGVINADTVLIEPTSGNTGIALAFVAASRGYRLKLVMPESMSIERRKMLAFLGAEIILTPAAQGMKGSIATAEELVRTTPNAVMPQQFKNLANPEIHRRTTAEEIWNDTGGNIDFFVAGVGTGGTITGAGRYLKEVSGGKVRIVGVDPEGSVYSGGTGRPYLVEGVGEDFWPSAYDPTVPDEIIAVSDADSFDMTRRLAREEALLVGGSCGMAVVAAIKVAEKAGPDALVVVLLPDGGRGYLSKVFDDAWMSSYGFLRSRLDGSVEESTVGDVLRGKSGALPDLVHTHPSETVRDAIGILREYGVSQMPVVGAEPPVMAGEVAGSVSERELLSAVFEGRAKLADAVSVHMSPPLPLIGAGELVSTAAKTLRECDAVMVVEEGKPVGVLTRHDLLGFLSDGIIRR